MNRLKELRTSYKLTTQQLADKLDMARSMLTQLENGQRNLTFERANSFAEFFGVSVEYIMGTTFEDRFKKFINDYTHDPDYYTDSGSIESNLLKIVLNLNAFKSKAFFEVLSDFTNFLKSIEDFKNNDISKNEIYKMFLGFSMNRFSSEELSEIVSKHLKDTIGG